MADNKTVLDRLGLTGEPFVVGSGLGKGDQGKVLTDKQISNRYGPPPVTPATTLPSLATSLDVGQGAANQMFDAQRQSLASQLAASRQAIQGSATTQQRQLAMQLQQAQRDYNLQRQQQQEQAFMQSRQLQQAAQVRGLGQSGLAQLAQLQQGMQQGQLTNQAAQGMQQTRLGYTEQAAANQQNLANQLLQLEANKQAGEAGIAAQQFQTNQALQQQSRDILTQLYSVARAGQDMTDDDWNFLATQYGIAPEYLESLKTIWQQIKGDYTKEKNAQYYQTQREVLNKYGIE